MERRTWRVSPGADAGPALRERRAAATKEQFAGDAQQAADRQDLTVAAVSVPSAGHRQVLRGSRQASIDAQALPAHRTRGRLWSALGTPLCHVWRGAVAPVAQVGHRPAFQPQRTGECGHRRGLQLARPVRHHDDGCARARRRRWPERRIRVHPRTLAHETRADHVQRCLGTRAAAGWWLAYVDQLVLVAALVRWGNAFANGPLRRCNHDRGGAIDNVRLRRPLLQPLVQ